MSRYSEQKQQAAERMAQEIARRRERGEPFQRLEVTRKRGDIAGTFWGNAWCANLEAWSDYQDRLPGGKTWLRRGTVYDLTIDPGEIFAYVVGDEIHEVLIRMDPVDAESWEAVKAGCAGQIGSTVDLLSGRLGSEAMKVLAHPEKGLFPRAGEIHFNCTCPDWADLCVHTAAVLFGVGVLLDAQPELLFTLRQADASELVGAALQSAGDLSTVPDVLDGDGELRPENLSALFGIEIAEPESAFPDS